MTTLPAASVTADGFSNREPSLAARLLRALAEIGFLGVLYAFAVSPGEIVNRHRVLLAVLAITLAVAGWSVWQNRVSGTGWRLWLLFGGGLALSLATKGANLARPPSPVAAGCAIVLGAAGILAALADRQDSRPTGFEGGLVAAIVLMGGVFLVLFPGVAAENSLDAEVLHNTLWILMDYTMLVLGLAVLSSRRGSYFRCAGFLSLACIIRLAWHHVSGQ